MDTNTPYMTALRGNLRVDFAVVVLGIHDDDEVSGDVGAPAERTRCNNNLDGTCTHTHTIFKPFHRLVTTTKQQLFVSR